MKHLLLLSISLLYVLLAQGQAGKLDRSFGDRGRTFVDMPKGNYYDEVAREILPQADGKYLVVFTVGGHTVLTRYQANGTRDNSFGTDGFSEPARLSAVTAALHNNGQIVVAGIEFRTGAPAVARFNADGTPDLSFGENGKAIIQTAGVPFQISDVAIQSNHKIVVVGGTAIGSIEESDFVLARLNSNGSPDNSLDGDGLVITDFGGIEYASALAIQADGKIVATGVATASGSFSRNFALVRYNPNGSLDNSFSGDGMQITDFGSSSEANDLAIQSNGKIIAVGYASLNDQAPRQFALARYNTDGSLDNSFSGDGRVITEIGFFSEANAVELRNDKIIVAGIALNSLTSINEFAVARYNPDGSLDNSFSGDGRVTTAFNDFVQVTSLLVENNGKIVVAGSTTQASFILDMAFVRYNPNGSLDNSFDGDGKLLDHYDVGASAIHDIAVQKDGKIVVAGFYFTRPDEDFEFSGFALARLNPDGTLDKSFGEEGIVNTQFDINARINAVAIQDDGKIVVAGVASDFDFLESDFALARYNPDGSLDNTFGVGGKVRTDLGSEEDIAQDLAIQKDGKIVVVGQFVREDRAGEFALVRYNPNGSLDNSFSGDGKVFTDFSTTVVAESVAVQEDGKIVVAGWTASTNTNPSDYALARYNANGSLDNSFGSNGKVTTDIQGTDRAMAVALQEDGKIVIAGSSYVTDFNANNFTLARYNVNGTLDNSFDGDGKVVTDFGADDMANDLVIQEDGKIIVAGVTSYIQSLIPDFSDFAIARYRSNGSLDPAFGNNGKVITDFGVVETATSLAIDNDRLYVGGFSTFPAIRGLLAAYKLGCVEHVYYRDKDKDGYGDPAHKRTGCSQPAGYVANNGDCNDHNAAIHPGAKEICGNMRDENCDGQVDEGCSSTPWVTINNVTVQEGDGKATLRVHLSKKSNQPVFVAYRTTNGSARGAKATNTTGRDYILEAGVVTIKPGSQHATISVRILNDKEAEGDEYFKVELVHARGATTNHLDEGRVTIKDDDAYSLSPDLTQPSTPRQEKSSELSAVHKLSVKALPNPSTSYFTLQLQSDNEGSISITVLDAGGRIIESQTGVAPNTTLPIGHSYRPGTYYVRVLQGGETKVLTLIKQAR